MSKLTDAGASRVLRRTLDGLAIAALALTLYIELTGGFDLRLWGVKLTAHRASRALAVLAVVVAIRVYLFGREYPRLRGWLRRTWALVLQPESEPRPADRILGRDVVWALGGLCAMTALLLHRQLRDMYAVPDLGDPLFSMWRLGWFRHWLEGDVRPFFSANIFYPHTLALAYSDSHLLVSLAALPLSALRLHPVVAYNVLLVASFPLSGLAMYLLVKHLTASGRAAFVAALLFAFYPFRFEHYSHLELQMVFWLPLALLALHRFLETWRRRWAIAASLAVVGQWYSSMYFALFFCLYAVAFVGVQWWLRRWSWRRFVPGIACVALVAVPLALPLALPYTAARAERGEREWYEADFYSAHARDYLTPLFRSATYGKFRQGPEYQSAERALFPGLATPTLAAVAMIPPFGVVTATYGFAALFAFDSSLGTHGAIYPHLYDWLPPIRGIRVPARFGMLVGMTLIVLAGYGAARLLARCRSRAAATALFCGLVAIVAVDLRPNLTLLPVSKSPPTIYSRLPNRPDIVLAEFPMEFVRWPATAEITYMYFSLWHWKNMVNGYSGFSPLDYPRFLVNALKFPDAAGIDTLVARGVTHVTVNCALFQVNIDCPGFLTKVDASPRLRKVASDMWNGENVVLYELVK